MTARHCFQRVERGEEVHLARRTGPEEPGFESQQVDDLPTSHRVIGPTSGGVRRELTATALEPARLIDLKGVDDEPRSSGLNMVERESVTVTAGDLC
ncbi:hypothetical protein [Nocardia gipuzkoensis]